MAEAFIVRRGGGGGSGGTLVVTSSGAGTVTVSNTVLGKSYSKTVAADGSVTFKGLKTGEWTVTLSNGAQTATRSVTINADYSVSVAYFSATISITYPANSTCVVTNSSGQTVASDSNTGSSTKTWTATVGATGTYTVTATATDGSGKSKSTIVSITADGQSSSVTLSYWNGEFYERGNQYAYITGGWQKTGNGTFSLNESDMQIGPATYGYNVRGTTINKVDISEFSSLAFTYTCTNGNAYVRAGIATITSPSDGDGWVSYVGFSTTSSEKVATLDVSSLTGSYYIVVSTFTGDEGGATINIKKVQGV